MSTFGILSTSIQSNCPLWLGFMETTCLNILIDCESLIWRFPQAKELCCLFQTLSNIGDMSALGMENWKLVRMYLIMMKGRGERRRLKVVWWMSRSSKVCITTEAAIRVNIAKSNWHHRVLNSIKWEVINHSIPGSSLKSTENILFLSWTSLSSLFWCRPPGRRWGGRTSPRCRWYTWVGSCRVCNIKYRAVKQQNFAKVFTLLFGEGLL